MKRINRLYLLFFIFLLLCGCSKTERTSEGVTEIRFGNWEGLPALIKLWQEVVDRFNSLNPDIKVKYEVMSGYQKVLVELAGGTAPDVFYWCTGTILAPVAKKKAVVDLTSFIKKDINPEIYFPFAIESVKFYDGIYGWPCYWNCAAFVYNKTLFDKAGITYPTDEWTWDEFLRIAQQLTIKEDERTIQYGCVSIDPLSMVYYFGGDFFDKDGTISLIDNPHAKDALQFVWDLRYKYQVAPTDATIKGSSDLRLFESGKVAMLFAHASLLPALREIKTFSWDVTPIPRKEGFKRRILVEAGCLSIPVQSKHPKEAWRFIKFACGPEGAAILAKGKHSIPSVKDAAYSIFSSPPPGHVRVYIDQVEEATFMPKFAWADEWRSLVFNAEVEKLLLNKQSVEETIMKIFSGSKKYLEK